MGTHPNYEIGDIVTWVTGKEYSSRMPQKGPFVVTGIEPGDEYCTRVSDMRTGVPCTWGASAYFHWRFQKNEFLTAARKAVTDAAKSR